MLKPDRSRKRNMDTVESVTAVLFAVIILTMFFQVLFRYILNQSLYWSEEIVRYLFVWLVFIGGALVTKDNGHIGIDYLLTLMPEKLRNAVKLGGNIIIVIVSLILVVFGIILIFRLKGSHSPALGLPINLFLHAAIPVASVFSAWYGIKNTVQNWKSLTNRIEEDKQS